MQNIQIFFADQVPRGTLSGGSWEASLPLANMQNERLSSVARSTDAALASTQFALSIPSIQFGFRAVVIGPTNLTTVHRYRIRAFNDSLLTSVAYDSGWVQQGTRLPLDSPELFWGHPSLWDGYLPVDDPERGNWIVHQIDADAWPAGVAKSHWKVDLDDTGNPDGYVQAGRFFMGRGWQPSINYHPNRNRLTFADASKAVQALSGAKSRRALRNPRVFNFGFDEHGLADAELFDEAYRFMRESGFAGQVFVVPNPADTGTRLQRRAMLATITQMDGLKQAAAGYGGAGFEVEEQL